jgi:ribosomal protein S18 acetylase RimI-like enzyme
VQIRTATPADLAAVERLRLAAFSGSATSAWRGVPMETQLEVRLRLWKYTPDLLRGLLVGLDGDRLVGTVTVGTTLRFAPRMLPALRPLGPARAARLVGVWALGHYEPPADEAFLTGLVVDPQFRRRAAGRELTAAAEDLARQWGKRYACVTVERTNTPSLRLVESLGYRIVPAHRRGPLHRLLRPEPTFVRAEKQL